MFLTTVRNESTNLHLLSVSYTPPGEMMPPQLSIWYGNPNLIPPFTFTPDEARQIAAALVEAADRYDADVDDALFRQINDGTEGL